MTLPYEVRDFDGHKLIVANTLDDAEAAYQEIQAAGIKIISRIEQMGRKWAFTCKDPEDRSGEVTVIKQGLHLLIKGPNEKEVAKKLAELVRQGGRAISAPTEATGGGWLAIVDDIDQVRKW